MVVACPPRWVATLRCSSCSTPFRRSIVANWHPCRASLLLHTALLSDTSRFSCEHQKWLRAFSCVQSVRQLGLSHRAELEYRKDLRNGMQEGDARTVSLNRGGFRRHASTATEDPKLYQEVAEEITLTDNYVRRIREIKLEDGPTGENKMLRLSVEGGGCSGFLYNFALDDKVNKDDRILERDGSKVVVEDISLGFIKGATVDFTDELIRSSFAVTINPNAASACGCGASFNAK